ncbi:neuropeptide-like protein 32 [Zingiber officinale]|uniref:Glycine-rich protein n=1 Tax=Zingiber officinale TaxID=94328 RepID=A0A8J5ER23_ZINOF|nr:neuropeptide-like protein 32 [Zingiber officinale]KAG6471078.1 hypothetical protein ZIOFF_072175 [Zingiber officinale]
MQSALDQSSTMRTNTLLLFSLLLLSTAVAVRDLGGNDMPSDKDAVGTESYIPGFGSDPGFYGGNANGGGYSFPGFGGGRGGWGAGAGGGWGGGYGGPGGGYARDGVVAPSVVCADRGPCYKKKLTCPAKCFTSYSYSGKGYGGGGGGGGCTMDCKKNCVAYC